MKPLIQQTKYSGSTGRKVMVALALATLMSSLSVSSAFADRNDNQDQGDWHGDHGQRGHHDGRGHRPDHQRAYGYEQRTYERPVYVPPPVYYEPRQSSGISFFFPLDFRR